MAIENVFFEVNWDFIKVLNKALLSRILNIEDYNLKVKIIVSLFNEHA